MGGHGVIKKDDDFFQPTTHAFIEQHAPRYQQPPSATRTEAKSAFEQRKEVRHMKTQTGVNAGLGARIVIIG